MLAGADFGVGVWLLLARVSKRRDELTRDALAYFSPRWEVHGLLLIFFLTGLFAAFPRALGLLGRALIPLVLFGLVLFVVRSAAYLLLHVESRRGRGAAAAVVVFGLASVGAGVLFAVAAAAPASGAITDGSLPASYYTGAVALASGILALLAAAHLAAVALAAHTARKGRSSSEWFRVAAVAAGLPALLAAGLFTLAVVGKDAHVRDRLLGPYAAPMLVAAALVAAGIGALARRRPLAGLLLTAAGYIAGLLAGAFAQLPYLVYPALTLHQAAAPAASVSTFVVATAVGGPLLVAAIATLHTSALRANPRQLRPE